MKPKSKKITLPSNEVTRNSQELESFTLYCQENTQERFWQALRNWSNVGFVGVSNDREHWQDTFYLEAGQSPDKLLNE